MGAPVIHHQNHSDATFTVTDAATSLSVRVEEVYRLIRSKRIHAYKDGGRWAVCWDCVHDHEAGRRVRNQRRANGNE